MLALFFFKCIIHLGTGSSCSSFIYIQLGKVDVEKKTSKRWKLSTHSEQVRERRHSGLQKVWVLSCRSTP